MNGILPLWKPKGLTSHDCVYKVRKILKMKKVGHTGTLDPDVTGVLPICLGRATKIAEYITDSGKVYEGEVTIGWSTTTEDASGDKVEEKKITHSISRIEILSVLQSLTGEISQTPPMFSAVKVNGKRLYEYARQGIQVDRPSRQVTIHQLELLDDREHFEGETITFRFRAACSKGTYIRTLAVEMGEKLGYPAHMSKLVRTNSASISKEMCITLEKLEEMVKEETIEQVLLPLEEGIVHLPYLELSDTLAEKVKNGAVLEVPKAWPENNSKVTLMYEGRALAIYQKHPTKPAFIKPIKVLFND
ncbi:tRNA pseudouridine(55) synthase TruB [Bacillus sp. 2205SS5-2]|uniref:tRNA pseudouridine(55) synthase TruB n=1 Tax=Bacillus sp. 2205SS5-2 TaxID=3109031 RepID=UPI003007E35D